jgi:RNA polymerase sigma factor (sigma-70 family)
MSTGDVTDGELLADFARTGSESAFAQLVGRHGRMAYRACLRVTGRPELADEASQAALMALARKARQVAARRRDVGAWVHRAAGNAARNAVQAESRRLRHEKEAAAMRAREATSETSGHERADITSLLDAAVDRLSEPQRQVVVGLYLEGRTRAQLAEQLGVPAGTVASRSDAALGRLRRQLRRRGVFVGLAALVAALTEPARAAEPPASFALLPGRAAAFAANAAASGLAAQLAEGVIRMMLWQTVLKWTGAAAVVLVLAIAGGVAAVAGSPAESAPALNGPQGPEAPAADVPHRGTLSARAEALRARFAKFYRPERPDTKPPRVPQYALPLEETEVVNWAAIAGRYLRDAGSLALVRRNGFAAVGFAGDDVVGFYHQLKLNGVPIFVTSDSLLHLYHIQFDETLKDIEEREFFDDALQLALACYEASVKQQRAFTDRRLKEAARRNAAYFAVALECLATDRSAAELKRARAAVAGWSARDWRSPGVFPKHFPAAYELAKAEVGGRQWELSRKTGLLEALDKAIAAARSSRKAVRYELAADIRDEVAAELALMGKHEGFAKSPIFKYKEDYSQYVPRGHYTRSEKLKRYFKALMWFGRMTMLIKGGEPHGPAEPYLVSEEDARIQTTGGLLAADLLRSLQLPDGRGAAAVWDRLYAVTAYYVGLADDLTPYEYTDAAAKALGAHYRPAGLAADKGFGAYRLELTRLRGPAIYSGTGACEGPPLAAAGEADLLDALEKTKGFRLMGQRYIPDSFMMGRLVYPTVAPWGGGEFAFTTVATAAGPARGFPRGLDVMAVLGSARARRIVRTLRDDNYPATRKGKSYDQVLDELRAQFAAVPEKGWNRNLYWAWLYCLQPLLASTTGDAAAGLPSFMRTEAWQDKQLNAALGSWSQLRHDTILYAKQSYTVESRGMPPRPRMVEGYVEPVPAFYARLLALTRMTLAGLGDMKVLTPESEKRMRVVERVLVRLVDISVRELQNEELTPDDYAFIRGFAAGVKGAVAGVSDGGVQTTIVADVHTDQNTKQCLEEGTGLLRNLVVVYPMPDGGLVAGVGPAFSYYEFKHPMKDRLTDEKWRAMLRGRKRPGLPEWTRSFSTGR